MSVISYVQTPITADMPMHQLAASLQFRYDKHYNEWEKIAVNASLAMDIYHKMDGRREKIS